MRVKFTTSLDEKLVEQLKINALKKKVDANDILEGLLKREYEVKCGAEKMSLSMGANILEDCKKISDLLLKYHMQAYENEKADRTDKTAASMYKNLYDNYLKRFWK